MTPRFCPMCGRYCDVVRHVMANIFEMLCESCDKPSVVHVNDQVKLPTIREVGRQDAR